MEVSIRISGAAGQGMATAGDMMGRLVSRRGLYCHAVNDAESRIRGGCNYSHLRIADSRVSAPVTGVDLLIALNQEAYETHRESLTSDGMVLGTGLKVSDVRYVDLESTLGGATKTAGTAAVAYCATLLGYSAKEIAEIVHDTFGHKEKILALNLETARLAAALAQADDLRFALPARENTHNLRYLSGADALSLGAVAGGVSLMAAYPMSPATSIMTNLANWAEELEIHVEQAEDEISAINMVAGAAYAGARALTATSGGGFALMTEGVSLLGMIETPAVIMIAQRPGPATGLPTRTAQGDLRFAIHGGHGFFPRVVMAPRNIETNFEIGAKSFDVAERFQVPVIVLTDQQLQDSKETVPAFNVAGVKNSRYILSPDELEKMSHYSRYAITKDGISPMAVPGSSRHTVVVDSDEHDEDGHLTELGSIADAMAEKRFAKLATVLDNMWLPVTDGEGDVAVLTWGSSCEVVAEAQRLLKDEGRSFVHMQFEWLWPLDREKLLPLFEGITQVIVVEHSTWPEFESVIREVMLLPVDHSIRRFDGRPFDVAGVVERLKEVLK